MYLIHRKKNFENLPLNMDFLINKNLIFEKHFIISLYLGMGKQITLKNQMALPIKVLGSN
jgi:hypothetical protein